MTEPHWLGAGDGGEVEARIGLHRMKLFPSYGTALAECVRWNRWYRHRWPDSDGHFGIEKYVKTTEETA